MAFLFISANQRLIRIFSLKSEGIGEWKTEGEDGSEGENRRRRELIEQNRLRHIREKPYLCRMKLIKLKPDNTSRSGSRREELLDGLNRVQREAAAIVNGPILILAGAGSGKTRVLTYRIACLMETGVQPQNILALTFTNKAAREMKERIGFLVGEEQARRLWAGTFHSIFARILRREAEHLGYTNAFSIYDTDDTLSVIRSVMNTLGISQQQYAPQAVRSRISSVKNQMVSWQEFQREADNIFDKQVGMIYQDYDKRLRLNNAMDFDDLLLNIIRLFETRPDILEAYQDRFRYLLVDEYQDTNRAQYMAVNMLAAKEKNLCVVGDDAQSIYRWRGADIRNILDFQRDYPDAKVVRLEQNYRSTKTILAAANNVIGNNRQQLRKELWTANDEGDPVHILKCRDDREEAEKIVAILNEERLRHGRSLSDFAILYRTNAQSQALEDAMRRQNLAYSIVGGVSFYKRKEVKDTLAYLKLVVNPSDNESFMRIVNEPSRGLGKTSLETLSRFAAAEEISLYQACHRADEIPGLQKRAQTAAHGFVTLMRKFIEVLGELPPDELAKTLIETSGLLKMYAEEGTEEALDRWNNIQRVLSHITEYTAREEGSTLQTYLQDIALIDDVDEKNTVSNHTTLMTLHAAKGLEFPVVFIAGMENGLFPLGKADSDPEEMEEERRLFYVGITRAEQKVFLSYAERRYRFGELTFPMPSRFLAEIDDSLVKHLGAERQQSQSSNRPKEIRPVNQYPTTRPGSTSQPHRSAPAPRPSAPAPRPSSRNDVTFDDIPQQEYHSQIPSGEVPLRRGMVVRHEMFGEGKVLSVSGNGNNVKAIIQFPVVGQKHLMLKYAKLQIISG